MKKVLLSLLLLGMNIQNTHTAFSVTDSYNSFISYITSCGAYKTGAYYTDAVVSTLTASSYRKAALVLTAAALTKYALYKKVDTVVNAKLENADQQLGYKVVSNLVLGSLTAYCLYKCFKTVPVIEN